MFAPPDRWVDANDVELRHARELRSKLGDQWRVVDSAAELTRAIESGLRVNLEPDVPVSEQDVAAAVKHVAQSVWLQFQGQGAEAYLAWKSAYGYVPTGQARVNADPMWHASVRDTLQLGKDAPDPQDWAGAFWSATERSRAPFRGVSTVEGANCVLVGRLRTSIPFDPVTGFRGAFPALLPSARVESLTFGEIQRARNGQGWPFFLAPPGVGERIGRAGTPLVEVVCSCVFPFNGVLAGDTLGTVVAQDGATRKWWIVQFRVYNVTPEGGFVYVFH
ncbi:MAG: hypothetical protein K2Q09_01605 [Phycisphaerales bacterium]|nr:hypothetical protein [Phycisphaerales bacterium]